ncbi:PREDICTED: GATA zinc finger domain-containing protein 7-like isoform X2 [Nicrophorus vespilloides]|uniref:GATA zinc finger domain-containing protein 7-like isoform X2 n=1 Tax=Nicrophorus vespilloides TaxID=110193 RepID=A0ABM1N4P6_NICVS|nr:PREDICTED: GATA zinc finger domain-containing protein 7-like isoform X2 [Nicrophorus vespilloides]
MEDKGKNDATAEVLEYYSKHAQNRNLSSYFCGAYGIPTPHPQPPTITTTSTTPPLPPQVISSNNEDQDVETSAFHSPTSSVASRKLEWDNGADIGYDHYEVQKLNRSISLPTITTQENNSSSNRLVFLNSSSDTESVRKNARESDEKEERSSSRKSESSTSRPSAKIKEDVLLFLKSKVGVPQAESTPIINVVPTHRIIPQKPPRANKKIIDKNVTFYSSSSDSKSNTSDKESSNNYYSLGDTAKLKSVVSSSASSDDEVKQKILENYPKARQIFNENKNHSVDDVLLKRREKIKLDRVNFSYDYPIDLKVKSSCSVENVSCSSDTTLKKWTSEFDLTLPQRLKYFNRYRSRKIKNLHVAKPICVECVSTNLVTDKVMQTCSENISVAIQTSPQNERVFYVKHSGATAKATDSSDASNSFEYFHGDSYNKSTKSPENPIVSSENNTLESKGDDGDQKSLFTSVETSSKEFSLSDIESQTKKEREANLKLLNKLIKSKKYDVKTKQYYLNKIMKKILSPNSGNSSIDSEHITPNIEPKIAYRVDQMVMNDNHLENPTKLTELHTNLPWKPAIPVMEPTQTKNKIFTMPTEKLPNSDCTNSSTEQSIGAVFSNNFILPKSDETTDWKSNKTASEIKVDSSGSVNSSDVMVKFAKNERDHQLNWINKEIEHLNKLRNYLEKNKTTQTPHFKDITNINKTTSVYMITTERPNEPTKDTNNIDSQDFRLKVDNVNEFSEIDFHLYSDQGNRDYKFKEIVAKLKPKGQMDDRIEAKTNENSNNNNNNNSDKLESTEYIKTEEHRKTKVTTIKEYKTKLPKSSDLQEVSKSIENKEGSASDMSQSRKSSTRNSAAPRKKTVEYSSQLEQRSSYKSPYSDSSLSANGQNSGKSLSVISSLGNINDEDLDVEEQFERKSVNQMDDDRIYDGVEPSQSKMSRQSSSTSRKSRDSRLPQEFSPELDDIDELYDEMDRASSVRQSTASGKSDNGSISDGNPSYSKPSIMSRQSTKKSLVNQDVEFEDDRFDGRTSSAISRQSTKKSLANQDPDFEDDRFDGRMPSAISRQSTKKSLANQEVDFEDDGFDGRASSATYRQSSMKKSVANQDADDDRYDERPSIMSRQSSKKKSSMNQAASVEDDDNYSMDQPSNTKQSTLFRISEDGSENGPSYSRHSTISDRPSSASKSARDSNGHSSKMKSLAAFNEMNRRKSDRPSAVSRQSSGMSKRSSSRGSSIRKSSDISQGIISRPSIGRENAIDNEIDDDDNSSEDSINDEVSKLSMGRRSPSSLRRKPRESGTRSSISIQEEFSRTSAAGINMAEAPSTDSRRSSNRSVEMLRGISGMKLPLDFENARIVSNTVESSSENPEDCVRRVVLEVPIEVDNKLGSKSRGIQTTKSIANMKCTSSSSSSGSSTSAIICSCCRKCMSKGSAIDITVLDSCGPRFCDPCLIESKKRDWSPSNAYFKQPQHKCTCSPLTSNMTIRRIRSTLEELRGLDSYESCCTCKEPKLSGVCSSCCNNGAGRRRR